MNRIEILKNRIKGLLWFFIVGLILSGITAFPLQRELEISTRLMGVPDNASANEFSNFTYWVVKVRNGLQDTYQKYPFIAYGTDWLAFAHIVIAIAFIGPLRDPVRNLWVIQFGMIACVLVVPFALVFGEIRGIPFFWRLIDCSFGVIGVVPLCLCSIWIKELEKFVCDSNLRINNTTENQWDRV